MKNPLLAAKISRIDEQKMLFVDETDKKVVTAPIKFPYYGSIKIDGFRCRIEEGRGTLTRSNKPIGNIFTRAVLDHPAFYGLDGELMIGNPTDPDAFSRCQSAFRTRSGMPHFTFWVFDDITNENDPFEKRLERLEGRKNEIRETAFKLGGFEVEFLSHYFIEDLQQLIMEIEDVVNGGHEGFMLRKPNGIAKSGRSTLQEQHLIKIKPFEDSEAMVIGYEEQMTNTNEAYRNELGHQVRSSAKAGMVPADTLGKFHVLDIHHGWRFKIGSGTLFNDKDRKAIWDLRDSGGDHPGSIGDVISYKFQRIGMKDVPRTPISKGQRSLADLDSVVVEKVKELRAKLRAGEL